MESILFTLNDPQHDLYEVLVDRDTREVYTNEHKNIGSWEVIERGVNLRALSNDGFVKEGFPNVAAVCKWLMGIYIQNYEYDAAKYGPAVRPMQTMGLGTGEEGPEPELDNNGDLAYWPKP